MYKVTIFKNLKKQILRAWLIDLFGGDLFPGKNPRNEEISIG
jgi:hypothetical protein